LIVGSTEPVDPLRRGIANMGHSWAGRLSMGSHGIPPRWFNLPSFPSSERILNVSVGGWGRRLGSVEISQRKASKKEDLSLLLDRSGGLCRGAPTLQCLFLEKTDDETKNQVDEAIETIASDSREPALHVVPYKGIDAPGALSPPMAIGGSRNRG
jgi:hypothetical protein